MFLLCSFLKTNIPYNPKEWDDGKGDGNAHIKLKESNWIEGLFISAKVL